MPLADAEEIYKGQARAGTRQFHAYATAYVVHKGCRWTVALLPVCHADPWDEVVRGLLRQARRAGVRVRYLLLDRGFYSVAVVRYLQRARCPFVMPVIRRGRRPGHPKGASGTWPLFAHKKSGWGRYTLRDNAKRQAAAFDVCAVCLRKPPRRPGRGKRARRVVWVYALWGVRPGSPEAVRQAYRKRFGIESSYRQLNQGRIRTSTRSPLLRLLYVGLALVLRNVWVWLHWEVLSQPRRGRRRVDLGRLPLQDLLGWLAGVAERLLGIRTERASQRPLRA
jgi:putative transposase